MEYNNHAGHLLNIESSSGLATYYLQTFHAFLVVLVILESFLFLALLTLMVVYDALNN